MRLPIYLDYAATTPVDPRVAEKMLAYLTPTGQFGNPASRTHNYGWMAAAAIENARQQVADLVHCDPAAIIWTSGATEANNLALKGIAKFYGRQGRHIITCKTEHKAVLEPCAQLEREGFEVTYLTPQSNGLVSLADLQNAIRKDTLLVSIMHANNETGVVQPITDIAEFTHSKGILLHVDAAQSAGKIPLDLEKTPIDLMSFSAHKIYGPKGIGALYLRRKPRLRLAPLLQGGGQEMGLRAGTLPTHQIVAMGEAFHLAKQEMETENARVFQLCERLWQGLQQGGKVVRHSNIEPRLPGILSVSFLGCDTQKLIEALPNLAVSAGSSCTSGSLEPSYVLLAMGLGENLARSAIRFSLGRFTTSEEIDSCIAQANAALRLIRR